jgi:hypothetical protein
MRLKVTTKTFTKDSQKNYTEIHRVLVELNAPEVEDTEENLIAFDSYALGV